MPLFHILGQSMNTGYNTNPSKLHRGEIPHHHGAAILTMLLLCGDVETNPVPVPSVYTCDIFELAVNWSQAAFCCDACDVSFHKTHVTMCTQNLCRH